VALFLSNANQRDVVVYSLANIAKLPELLAGGPLK
jgi:hypothetical protein